jgi:hypothetical protein
MLTRSVIFAALSAVGILAAQDPAPNAGPDAAVYRVEAGIKIPLALINSISTKHSAEGDRVYLETAFPILAGGRIVIPVGSYVAGTVTQIKKPGRVKGRGELYVRFDALTLPNGVTRDFHARMGGMDAAAEGSLDREEGKVLSETDKGGDMRTIGEAAGAGATAGGVAGSAAGHAALGVGIGAAAGAAAGLIGVLASRGPDAVLAKGSTVEMVLDRELKFSESDVTFNNYQAPRAAIAPATTQTNNKSSEGIGFPRRRIP